MIFWEIVDGLFLYGNLVIWEKLGYINVEFKVMKVDKLVYNFFVENRAEFWVVLWEYWVLDWEGELKVKDGMVILVYCFMNFIWYKDKEINCVFVKDWCCKKVWDECLCFFQFMFDEVVDMIFWVDDIGVFKFVN